jgi:hypothetical protein
MVTPSVSAAVREVRLALASCLAKFKPNKNLKFEKSEHAAGTDGGTASEDAGDTFCAYFE